ncbi:ubiquinone biosynthesis accessory factor UbiK [Thalassomonas sp. M1454]|uniref:ubiquinone biosynthesis accessory factor UbiK n=1 Tax=Thalassomonas sp. M1454 TaxID=2594477 RepID=UPI00117D194B|nr:accessory factor UbiK family protein [Thalassomonas sp. M1454]TRX58037.1 accessory factor UbiK family protein [Thalassomonas sp. M1454]
MINAKKIEDIAKQITDSIPGGVKNIATDIESKTKQVLQSKLSQLDVVSREEFDVQTQVLIKTRAKLDEMAAKIAELEAKIDSKED